MTHRHLNSTALVFIVVFFLHFNSILSYVFVNHQINDLERTDACFDTEAAQWSASLLIGSTIKYTCSSTAEPMIGGYNILGATGISQKYEYFSRTFNGLPSHTMLYFKLRMYMFSTWDGNDRINFQIDSSPFLTTWSMTGASFVALCGISAISDLIIQGSISHTLNQVTFRVVSGADESSANEAFGLRDMQMLIVSSPTLVTTQACPRSSTITIIGQCACAYNYYENPIGSSSCYGCTAACAGCFGGAANQCYACAVGFTFDGSSCIACSVPGNCATCSGAGVNQCTSCKTGYSLYNNGTCVATALCSAPLSLSGCGAYCDSPCSIVQYVFLNGSCTNSCTAPFTISSMLSGNVKTCISSCPAQVLYWDVCDIACPPPLVTTTVLGQQYCSYPCLVSEYLYWNGSCASYCSTPSTTIIHSRNLCLHCPTTTDFMYWNGTCAPSCDPMLTPRVEGTKNFCDYQCLLSQWVYWNGSCMNSCTLPLQSLTISSRQFCRYPCGSLQFLTQGGSCINSCLSPYTSRVEGTVQYCDAICASGFYQLENGTCTTCPAPMRLLSNSSGTFCYGPCNTAAETYIQETAECTATCNTIPIFTAGLYYRCIMYYAPVEPVYLVRPLQHLRYSNLQLPLRLRNMKVTRAQNILSLRINPNNFVNWYPDLAVLDLADVFEKYDTPSSFLTNFLPEFLLLAILVFILIFVILLEVISDWMMWDQGQFFFERLKVLLKWNLPIMIITTNMGDIIFFAILEFSTYDHTQHGSLLSLSLCIMMITALIALFILTISLVIEAQAAKRHVMSTKSYAGYQKFLTKWESFQVLFRGYKDNFSFVQAFYLIYSVRTILPMLISVTLYNIPLLQNIFYIVINIAIVVFLVLLQPIQKRIDHINLLAIEGIILAVNISGVLLTVLDKTKGFTATIQAFFGDLVIAGNFSLNIISIMFLIIKLSLGIQQALNFKQEKASAKKQKSAWLQLLFLPLQQGAFSFEQMQVDRFINPPPRPKKISQLQVSKEISSPIESLVKESSPYKRQRVMGDFGAEETRASGAFAINKISSRVANSEMNEDELMNESELIRTTHWKAEYRGEGELRGNSNFVESFPINKMGKKKEDDIFADLELPNRTMDTMMRDSGRGFDKKDKGKKKMYSDEELEQKLENKLGNTSQKDMSLLNSSGNYKGENSVLVSHTNNRKKKQIGLDQ